MAEILGRVERISGTMGNQQQITGQGQVKKQPKLSQLLKCVSD